MLSKFVELAVMEVFSAHVYEYGGRIYEQADGGPIGLSLSGAIGRTTMAVWDGEVGRLYRRNGIKMRFRRRYVNNCNGAMESWRKGWRWNGSRMEWRRKWEKEEIILRERDDVRCWREWGKMVDTVWSFIKVTYDCPGLNSNGLVPILDVNIRMEWQEEEVEGVGSVKMQQIVFRFYQKPMNSPYVIMANSAMPMKVKVTTMVQEVIRRLRNMSKWVKREGVQEEMTKFCVKMKMSGYKEGVRRDVLLSGIKGYERMKSNHEEGKRYMYRKQEEGKEVRWTRKISGKESRYKGKGEGGEEGEEITIGKKGKYVGGVWWRTDVNREKERVKKRVKEDPEVVVFIPHTPNGILKERLQEKDRKMVEAMGMRRIKFVEREGRPLKGVEGEGGGVVSMETFGQ